MPQSVITANRLTDGVVVWLGRMPNGPISLPPPHVFDDEALQSTR